MKKILLAGLLFGLFSSIYADVPVVDYSTEGEHSLSRIANSMGTESVTQTQDDFVPSSNLPVNQRLNKLEQQLHYLNQQNLPGKIDELQERVQKLNGQLEEQSHQISQLNEQLKNFYQDLNQRVDKPKSNLSGDTIKPTPQPKSNGDVKVLKEGAIVNAGSQASMLEPKPVVGAAAAVANTPISSDIQKPQTTAVPNQRDADNAFLKEQQMYQTAIDLLPSEKSAQKLRDYLSAYPKGVYVSNAYYWLGEIYFLQKKYDAAEMEFKTVIEKFPTAKKVSDAYFKLALIHQNQGKRAQAKIEFVA